MRLGLALETRARVTVLIESGHGSGRGVWERQVRVPGMKRARERGVRAEPRPGRSSAAVSGRPGFELPAALSLGVNWRALGRGERGLVVVGLVASLVLLLVHALHYRFLTDDAFISFRYARNLSHGHGLVFNPGFEAVEGYSNFLFVLVLAGLAALGAAPETIAPVLTLGATVALWATVAGFALRHLARRGRAWLAVVPLGLLAATRSVAVWSTSGLETRWFEALLTGGVLRLAVEVEAALAGRRRRPVAVWLLALATLTRPDGLLISVCALGIAALFLGQRQRLEPLRFALELLPFLTLVGGHVLWRRAYYGAWLPNTYYAKVGGHTWWSLGLAYGAAFALEYAVYLWIPLIVLGVLRHVRRGSGFVPLLFAGVVLPHALYVIAIGGDHFEYRPMDLYFPFLYLLLADGLNAGLERRPRLGSACAAYLALVLAGIWELPAQSHRQFADHYIPGFPGCAINEVEGRGFLDPARSWLYRWPGPDRIALAHRERIREISAHFAGLRQEEHLLFLATVEPEGRILRRAVEQGLLPSDLYVAMGSVGVIPYYSDLRTLDILGLTDAQVAHAPAVTQLYMAHDRRASFEYARARGVDLWAETAYLVYNVGSPRMLGMLQEALSSSLADSAYSYHAADLGHGDFLVAFLVEGGEQASRRMPRLRFRPVADVGFLSEYLQQGIAAYRERLRVHPGDGKTRFGLASLLALDEQYAEAGRIFGELSQTMAQEPDLWSNWAECREGLGDLAGAADALRRAEGLAEARLDSTRLLQIRANLARIESTSRRSPG